jgi:hypothetical protein
MNNIKAVFSDVTLSAPVRTSQKTAFFIVTAVETSDLSPNTPTPSYREPHLTKDDGAFADNLTGTHRTKVKGLFFVNRSCIHGGRWPLGVPAGANPEDSSLAVVGTVQMFPAT